MHAITLIGARQMQRDFEHFSSSDRGEYCPAHLPPRAPGGHRQGYDRLSGGGSIYSGDCIHDVHAGFGITQAEFYGLVQILNDAMVRPGLAIRGCNELLALLSPMKRDVVEC